MMKRTNDFLYKINSFLDSFYFIIICLAVLVSSSFIIAKVKPDGELSFFSVYILSPILLFYGVYGLIRVWNKAKFIQIDTNFTKDKNEELLINYLKYRMYSIVEQTENSILVIEDESTSINELWTKHIWFKIADNSISFNVQKHYPLLNPPVLYSHLLLERDLKIFINKRS